MEFREVITLNTDSFRDERGELWTTWDKSWLSIDFNRDKVSTSLKDVVRGLHGDYKSHKLVSCIVGELFFVIVDNRKDSETYLQHETRILSDKRKEFILLPPGFANGFAVLSEFAVFNYKWSYVGEYPDVEDQFSLRWNDPKLRISWPRIDSPILSDRDNQSKLL